MRKNICMALIFTFTLSITVSSQQIANSKISGKVFLENKKAAAKATISLLRQKDSSTVKLSIPDENGSFEFENLKSGNYLISVSYTGYKKYFTAPFKIDDGS